MYSLEEIRSFAGTAELKRLLTTVETALKSPENSVIAVSSAQRSEGKTLTAISVAMSTLMLHKNYGKVLVMDLNWHEPVVHQYFGIDIDEEVPINGKKRLEEMVLETDIPGLDLLVPSRAVMRCSTHYDAPIDFAKEIIEQAREQYSLTIIDTRSIFPPNKGIRIDPIKVCSEADAVLIVTLAAVTPRQEVNRAIKTLETSKISNIGVVLNQWRNPIHQDRV